MMEYYIGICECCGQHDVLKVTHLEQQENEFREVIYEYIEYVCIECWRDGYIEEYY